MTTFLLVGAGYRTRLLLEVAERLPGLRCGGVLARTPRPHRHPVHTDLDEAVRTVRPDFALVSVAAAANPGLVLALVERGVPVLAETPPAPDLDGLRSLWAELERTGSADSVQVAEQYLRMPMHAARRALVRSGALGTPTQVQVSSTQTYHAVSIIRGLLEVGRGPATVTASRVTAPLVQPLDRGGWTDDDTAHPATTTIATLDFGDGRSGLYDFTDQQTRNLLRHRRLVVRGSRGELDGDRVVRLGGARTLLSGRLERRQVGYDVDLNGYDTELISYEGEVLWRNAYLGQRFMDEELAVASMLEAMITSLRGDGPPPYALAEACADQALGLAVERSAAERTMITTAVEPWS
ncbi:putative dehydrogenase [Friedmanniella endophytica]|uniref:Putative dehydrogenase n=1 Tax=Microlunatus kandeliicorticis TaxID=1759536 RepID=A0A7W3P6T8_9ACTN|nr:Gfo/Idh/MocA family oxidoreductase [Microlunatus kandeliicorticis]MBA8795406.1 putative dehydrogenase [Microlunatus kandeliicorticis]